MGALLRIMIGASGSVNDRTLVRIYHDFTVSAISRNEEERSLIWRISMGLNSIYQFVLTFITGLLLVRRNRLGGLMRLRKGKILLVSRFREMRD